MKKMFVCALAAAAWVVSQGLVSGADEPKTAAPPKPAVERPNRPPGTAGGGGGQRVDRIKQMAEQLGLTQEQQDKLKPILAEEAKKMRELRQDTTLSNEQRREKMAKLREENQKALKDSKILTDDQLKKWEKIQEDNRKRAQERRPRSAPAPAPAPTK